LNDKRKLANRYERSTASTHQQQELVNTAAQDGKPKNCPSTSSILQGVDRRSAYIINLVRLGLQLFATGRRQWYVMRFARHKHDVLQDANVHLAVSCR